MKLSKLFFWILLLIGEAIIITCFLMFSKLPDDIRILNITVASLVYILLFVGIKPNWIDLKDKSQKQVGGLGISWVAIALYAMAAIGFMIIANIAFVISFRLQLIIQIILAFFLMIGLFLQMHTNSKVKEVYDTQTKQKAGVTSIKRAIEALKNNISLTSDLPQNFIDNINSIDEEIRYMRPSNNDEAEVTEFSILTIINDIDRMIKNYSVYEKDIDLNVKKLEMAVSKRKSLFSN